MAAEGTELRAEWKSAQPSPDRRPRARRNQQATASSDANGGGSSYQGTIAPQIPNRSPLDKGKEKAGEGEGTSNDGAPDERVPDAAQARTPPPQYRPPPTKEERGFHANVDAELTVDWMKANLSPRLLRASSLERALRDAEEARKEEDRRERVKQPLEGPKLEALIAAIKQAQKLSIPGLQSESKRRLEQVLRAAEERQTQFQSAFANTCAHADRVAAAVVELNKQAFPLMSELAEAIGKAGTSHYESKIAQFTDVLERITLTNAEELQRVVKDMNTDRNTILCAAMGNILNAVSGLNAIEKSVQLLREKNYARALGFVKEDGILMDMFRNISKFEQMFS